MKTFAVGSGRRRTLIEAAALLSAFALLLPYPEHAGWKWIPGTSSILLALYLLSIREPRGRESRRVALGGFLPPRDRTIAVSSILLSLGFFVVPEAVERVPSLEGGAAMMALPFLACLVLTGIHSYLGIHVTTRGVIFVDLSLAQIAALGSTFAFVLGHGPESTTSYVFSLAFTMVGAALFALSRMKDGDVPQEAVIGIAYAGATALVVLAVSRGPQGAEHIEKMLTGSILWVGGDVVRETAGIYSLVGIFHYVFNRIFRTISEDPRAAERAGLGVRFWDFLFYASFGFVITSSVALAGVLLVFSFLVVPAVVSGMFTADPARRLWIGWLVGTVASVAGLIFSYEADLSSGPAVVVSFGSALVLASASRAAFRLSRSRRGKTGGRTT